MGHLPHIHKMITFKLLMIVNFDSFNPAFIEFTLLSFLLNLEKVHFLEQQRLELLVAQNFEVVIILVITTK